MAKPKLSHFDDECVELQGWVKELKSMLLASHVYSGAYDLRCPSSIDAASMEFSDELAAMRRNDN